MRVFTNNSPGANLVFTFDTPITAFGADFRNLNDVSVRTRLLVGGDVISVPVNPPSLTFFGVQSATQFTTITFEGLANDVYGIDNVSYAFVPEPSTLALAAGGLLGLGLRRRKRAR
jgi:hypothetical protein